MPPDADDHQAPETKAPADVDARLGAIETRQDRQEGLLQQILDRLPGQPSAPGASPGPPGAGPSNIAELVRQGVAELEQRKLREQRETDADSARKDHAERLAALEEAMPREPAATPAGRIRSWAQQRVFGIDEPHR